MIRVDLGPPHCVVRAVGVATPYMPTPYRALSSSTHSAQIDSP